MKKSDYYLIIGRDFNNKRVYSLGNRNIHNIHNIHNVILLTNNKTKIKMTMELMGLKIRKYITSLNDDNESIAAVYLNEI